MLQKFDGLKRIMGEKKKVILTTIVSFLVIIAMVVGLMVSQIQEVGRTKYKVNDPELARAMTYGEFELKDEDVEGTDNVKFGAFFLRDLDGDGYAEKIKGTCKKVGESDTLYISLRLQTEGILKNAKIFVNGENSYFQTAIIDDEVINGNYISVNTKELELKEVNVGTQKLMFGNVRSGDYTKQSKRAEAIKASNDYDGKTRVTLRGTYVSDDGTEIDIEKNIDLNVDWYGYTRAEIPTTYGAGKVDVKYQDYDIMNSIDEVNKEIRLDFNIVTQETKNEVQLAKAYIEGEIPELNGYAATDVKISGTDVKYTYDKESRKYTAWRSARLNSKGEIVTNAFSGAYEENRYTEFKVAVTYPLEAYETMETGRIDLNIPVKAYYEGYTNVNEEFAEENVDLGLTRSEVASDIITASYRRFGGDVIGIGVNLGRWVQAPYNGYVISKDNPIALYNGEELENTKEIYEVKWAVERDEKNEVKNVILKEPETNYSDKFLTTDGSYVDMEKYVSNVGIYFTYPSAMFGKDGYIDVINDETDELVHRFTAEDWDKYTSKNPYMYDGPINHVRLETSQAAKSSFFIANHVKQLDDAKVVADYEKSIFDSFVRIYSYLKCEALIGESTEYRDIEDFEYAYYEERISLVKINSVKPEYVSTKEEKTLDIQIQTLSLNYNSVDWVNGQFLLKLPSEILSAEVENVIITNSDVEILGYDLYKDENDGNYYLKIITENDMPATYMIDVFIKVIPDSRKVTAIRDIELWAYNENANNYKSDYSAKDIYDVNGNENTEEQVGYSKKELSLVGPSTLITTEAAKKYDKAGNEISTKVAPQLVLVDRDEENRTAEVAVQLMNNYSGNISEVKVIGKTPFEGNKTQFAGKDLGSTYTANMVSEIVLPEKLQGIATVYYSYNEAVTADLEDAKNGWLTEVDDYSKVENYLIDFGEYVLAKGEEVVCTYEIDIPEGIDYNEITYSSHAAYFSLETDEGKLRDQTETNKLGFMIARNYNLEVNKLKAGTDEGLSGAIFTVTEEGQDNSKIVVTDRNGLLNVKGLYVERVYVLKEIRAPQNYIKDEREIKFTCIVNENGELEFEVMEGSFASEPQVSTEDAEIATITAKFENEPRYKVVINKVDKDTNGALKNVEFLVKGKGFEDGKIIETNKAGLAEIKGLYANEVYEISEVLANGYYVADQKIMLTVKRDDAEYSYVLKYSDKADSEEAFNITKEELINEAGSLPQVNLTVTNEKVPTYKFNLTKYAKGSDSVLAGAQFTITGPGKEAEVVTTDSNGVLAIDGLYEYVEGRNIDGVYTLRETLPPVGYALNDEDIKFRAYRNEAGELEIDVLEGSFREAYKDGSEIEGTEQDIVIEGDVIKAGVEDEPLFKLVKVDGSTGKPLQNTKFAIYEVDEDGNELEAKDAKGNVVGALEVFGRKEYRIITTDEAGVININLRDGLYKVIEVQALDGYVLEEDIADRTYYFGIGKTLAEVKEWVAEGIDKVDSFKKKNKSIVKGLNGEYAILGTSCGAKTIPGDQTASGEDIVFRTSNNTTSDPIIEKYNSEEKLEWIKNLGGLGSDYYVSGVCTDDNEYVIVGYYSSEQIVIPQEDTASGEKIVLNNNGGQDLLIIRYTADGKVRWAKSIGGDDREISINIISVSDGGFLVSGYFYNDTIVIPAEETVSNEEITITNNGLNDVVLIKYTADGKIEWSHNFGGSGSDYLYGLSEQNDGFLTAGSFQKEVIIPAEETVSSEEITLTSKGGSDAVLIKYRDDGKIEWIKTLGGAGSEEFKGISLLKDGGYTVYGQFMAIKGTLVIPAEETVKGEEIVLNNDFVQTILTVRYNAENKIEWAKFVPGESNKINSGLDTDDGGCIVGGWKTAPAITIPAEETAKDEEILVDGLGLILKYNKEGKIEWANTYEIGTDALGKEILDIKKLENNRILLLVPEIRIAVEDNGELVKNVNDVNDAEYALIRKSIAGTKHTEDGGKISLMNYQGGICFNKDIMKDGKEKRFVSQNGSGEGLIIKYDNKDKIEWIRPFGGDWTNWGDDLVEIDDGYIILGSFNEKLLIDAEDTKKGEDIVLEGKGEVLIKIDKNGLIDKITMIKVSCNFMEFAKGIDGVAVSIEFESGNGNDISVDNTVSGEKLVIQGNGSLEQAVVAFDNECRAKWGQIISANANNFAGGITGTDDGGYISVGTFWNPITFNAEDTESGQPIILTSHGAYDWVIVKYNSEGKIEWAKANGGAGRDEVERVHKTTDNGYIIVGESNGVFTIRPEETVSGEEIVFTNKGDYDNIIVKYSEDNLVEWAHQVGGSKVESFRDIIECEDGFLVLGSGTGEKFIIPAEETVSGEEIEIDGIYRLLKYNKEGLVEWGRSFTNLVYYLNSYKDGEILAGGYKVYDKVTSPEIPEKEEIIIGNEKKEYKITTEIGKNSSGERLGGTITGEYIVGYPEKYNIKYVETVKYGEESTENIIITPDEGYKVIKVLINGTEIPFAPNVNGTVALDVFTDVKTDKHVVAVFSNNASSVSVHHHLVGTGSEFGTEAVELAQSEYIPGEIGSFYTTAPRLNISNFEVAKNVDVIGETSENPDSYYIPDNARGTYALEEQEVVYYYKEKGIPLTVNYYIEGTTEQVPLADGSLAEQVQAVGQEGENYTTEELSNVFDGYELVQVPANAQGVYAGDEIIVNYYYKLKTFDITTEVKTHEETDEFGVVTQVKGGQITGENNVVFETVEYAENSQKEIAVKADDGYFIKSIIIQSIDKDGNVQEENVEVAEKIAEYVVPQFENVTASKHVVVEFAKVQGKVVVHHYKEGTTESLAPDEEKFGVVGENFATKHSESIPEYYELVSTNRETSGKYSEEVQEIIYYYGLKNYSYTVEYYYDGTMDEAKTVVDEAVYGDVIDSYEDKTIPGYRLEKDENNPLTIGADEANNVIKVYYVIRTDLEYKVNYIDKETNEPIREQMEVKGKKFGDVIHTVDEVLTIEGYKYVGADKDSMTIGEDENVLNIYYTRRTDLRYLVYYIDIETDDDVIPFKSAENQKFGDKILASDEIAIIPGYDFVKTDKDVLTIASEINVISIYYRKKDAQVIVHHYEEGTTNKLSETVTIDGKVFDEYTTTVATDVPVKYELAQVPDNASGVMTEEPITVTYYYKVKDASLVIKYIEKNTNLEIAQSESQTGKVDEDYITGPKTIENYTLVDDTGNTTGKLAVEPITVIFYYLQNTKVTVQYIDKATDEILEEVTESGLVGDKYTASSKDFEDYILVEKPEQETVTMGKEEIVLKYYYAKVSGGVIEKHIDVATGDILENEVHAGNEGEPYNIPSRTFEGYDLVEDKLPTNSEGVMGLETIEVIYYYSYRSSVIAKYIDQATGNVLAEDVVLTGHEGDSYITESKDFNDYKLVQMPENAFGVMTKEQTIVTYYYLHKTGGVLVRHLDVMTGEPLAEDEVLEGYEGEAYKTEPENIPYYDLVKDKYPENGEGTMTKDKIVVNYYYVRQAQVNVKYVDKATGKEIKKVEIILGHEGDSYTTESKDITGFDLVQVPENKDGKMTKEAIEVVYYYLRPAKVIVSYIDGDTNRNLAEDEVITGHQSEIYTTMSKEIQYYTLTKVPANSEGRMTVNVAADENGEEIVNNVTYVNYYYRRKTFNLSVDKKVESVIVNGVERRINADFGKVEINRKEIGQTNIQVVYSIVVTNNSELSGKAKLLESIPNGMIMKKEKNTYWNIAETVATIDVDELKPGEYIVYEVVLDWAGGEDNLGMKENTAQIINTENEAGFEEKDTRDNTDTAELIMAVGTGEYTYVAGAGIAIIVLAAIGVIVVAKKKKE